MKTKRFLALVLALVMAFSLVVPASANTSGTIPDQPAKLTHNDTETHDTAKMTVYVTTNNEQTPAGERTSVAAVGAINSHMDATLELNYGTYPVDGTITAYGQTEEKANKTTFTLDGTSNTSIEFSSESEKNNPYFPGLKDLGENTPYYIQFVNAMGTTDDGPIGDYAFKKETIANKGITLTATNRDGADEVDAKWQSLKRVAFVEDSINDGDSYISLAAGSYIALNTEKLIAAGTLKLDDFSSATRVQDNIDNAKKQLMLATGTDLGYQILLKQGTRFKLGNSYAKVSTDLLITMTGNEAFNADGTLLSGIYDNLDSKGKADLAQNMLNLFSYIAGSVRSTEEAYPVVITFGRPTSSSSQTGDTTVETTVTKNEAGTNDVTTVKTTTTTDGNNVETTTVTTTSSTVRLTTNPTDTTNAQYSVNFASQTVTTTVGGSEPVQPVVSGEIFRTNTVTLNAAPAESKDLSTANTSANIVAANLGQLTEAAKATIVTEAVTQAQESSNDVTVTLAIVATALNDNNETTKRYEVKPFVTTKVGNEQSSPVPVSNDSLQGNFEIKLPVPAAMAAPGNQVKVTHRSTGYEDEVSTVTVAEDNTVTITVTHFSEFKLEIVETGSDATASYGFTLALKDNIEIPFYVYNLSEDASHYHVSYSYTDANDQPVEENVTLGDAYAVSGESDWYRVVVATFSARQMGDIVHVKLYTDENNPIYEVDYSIKKYCEGRIKNSPNTELINLCKATLDYGRAAQINFNYKVETPVSDSYYNDLTKVQISPEYSASNPADFGFVGTTISLKSQVAIKFYFANNDGYTYTVGGKTVTPQQVNDHWVIQVDGIAAKNLDKQVTVTVSDGNYSQNFRYSPMNYAYGRQENSPDQNLIDVCKALYLYWSYANDYLN